MKAPNFLALLSMMAMALLGTGMMMGCQEEAGVMQPAVSKLVDNAKAAMDSGDIITARCRLQSARSLAPESYQVNYNLAVMESQEMNWLKAIEGYQDALAIKKDEPDSLYGLAMAYKNAAEGLQDKMLTHPNAALKEEAQEYRKACVDYSTLFLEKAASSDNGRTDIEQVKASCER